MEHTVRKLINEKLAIPVFGGEDKRCSIKEAISRHVKEKMALSLSAGVGALLYEVIRAFWNKKPEFTIITPSINMHLVALVKKQLARKIITSFAGISYPSPRPCPVVQNAYACGAIEIESWTMRTIPQRLLAGAMGWDFMPTHSLIGSSMEKENHADFKTMDNPFAAEGKIGMLRALHPDITLVHAAVADASGNTIITYPLSSDAYGAWASSTGVIVSVDKIVSTDYIRRHAHMVRIPSSCVLAVCEAPFGAHPAGTTQLGLPDFGAYFSDYDFMIEVNEATKDEAAFERWIQEWILDVRDHQHYLDKLGSAKLLYLKGKAAPDAWIPETVSEAAKVDFDLPPNAAERVVLAAGKVIAGRCRSQGYDSLLAGIGMSNLAAWLAYYDLKATGLEVDLMAEIGMYGYVPRGSDPAVFSMHNMNNCKMLSNIETVLGVNVGGAHNRCLGVLGAGQIDAHGNANSTKVSERIYLVGSGGANDIANTNRETIVVMKAGKTRLVEKVPYITYAGTRVRTLVTDVGLFEKVEGRPTFTLTAYLPEHPDQTEARCMQRVRESVGWELDVAPALKRLELPDGENLALLRLFDPRKYYLE